MTTPFTKRTKDPQDVEDFYFIFEPWLDGETLSVATVTAETGITASAGTIVAAQVTVDDVTYAANTVVQTRISGGTNNNDYDVTCHVTSSGGRQKDKTATIEVRSN